jgi:autotransporter-associated beta strand protein
LVKDGSGTWTLNGTNTYAGPTLVSNGTLLINAPLWNSSVTVGPAAMFGGTAAIPGNITFLPGAQAQFMVGSVAPWGGTLTLNNNTVNLMLGNQTAPGTYPLATYLAAGSTGTFNSVPVIDSGSLAVGCTATIQSARGNVNLVVLPPPAPHLAIVSVAGGSNAVAGIPFSVVVEAQDTNGNPWTVSAARRHHSGGRQFNGD